MFKALILILIAFGFLFDLITSCLDSSWRKTHPLPRNVTDVYDPAQYDTWQRYSAEKKRLSLMGSFVSAALAFVFYALDLFAHISKSILPAGEYASSIMLVLFWTLLTSLVGLPFGYVSQMKIEEKYGFNRSTHATFLVDFVKETVIGAGLMCGLTAACVAFYHAFGPWFILAIYLLIAAFSIVVSTFSLTFMKLFNKFEPLQEGSLRSRLTAMFEKSGYRLKNIYVMNASKRTTKANAFCAGLGRYKEIALYDNLVNHFTDDEILAVFAHELTHFRHSDTRHMTVLNLIRFLPAAVLFFLMAENPALLHQLGFDALHFGIILITLAEALLGPVMTLADIPVHAVSRAHERRADTWAAGEGLGQALVSALKKLARGNFANLNPHPVNVALSYTHPPISERVAYILEADKQFRHN